jgi:hypothetical protein
MLDLNASWPWLTLVALGAFHGLNPAMGWLFAVALGFQERRLRGVVLALGPIAVGHALAIGTVAIVVGMLGLVIPQRVLLAVGGVTLLAFAAAKVITRFRHPRWVGMRVTPLELVCWSFLMATAHGAGLMLIPVLVRLRPDGVPVAAARADHAGHLGHAGHLPAESGNDAALGPALAAVTLHSVVMLAVAGLIAVLVYRRLGVDILRRAWINFDLIWLGALTVTGSLTLAVSLGPLLAA